MWVPVVSDISALLKFDLPKLISQQKKMLGEPGSGSKTEEVFWLLGLYEHIIENV
jgi:hypothetical protein